MQLVTLISTDFPVMSNRNKTKTKTNLIDWLIDWMVFYATFNSISVISRRQLTLFMSFLGFTSTRLGSEVDKFEQRGKIKQIQ